MKMVKIKLKKKDKIQLEELLKKGVARTRQLTRARVLLLVNRRSSPSVHCFKSWDIRTIHSTRRLIWI